MTVDRSAAQSRMIREQQHPRQVGRRGPPPIRQRLYNRLWRPTRRRFWEAQLSFDISRFNGKASDRSGLRLPNFVIIGAPKCGTSWLRLVLAEHPGIIMVHEEIEFFSHNLGSRLEWYRRHFAEDSPALDQRNAAYRAPYRDCLIGEKSASYCSIPPQRIDLVHRFLPEARLILMIREPIQRHWAHAKRYYSKKWRCDIADVPEEEVFRFFRKTRKLGEHANTIENWTAAYGEERLLVLLQEEALADPVRCYECTLAHIGLPREIDLAHFPSLSKRVNPGPKSPINPRAAEFLAEMFAPERERLRQVVGDRLAAWDQTQDAPP